MNFGDTAADIRSAQAAGVYTVGVLTGDLGTTELQQLKADAIVGSAADGGELIAKI
ncbi:HAD family hydrolase [Corynebacterium poyangense]|uniref:HAD family hydrolase n=1 Tax=Corynebacterium poyangense TaxID=2684405 RepID=UPI0021CDD417|nr:HAD hydrolase-like protein [Corynebacterium poyangense]